MNLKDGWYTGKETRKHLFYLVIDNKILGSLYNGMPPGSLFEGHLYDFPKLPRNKFNLIDYKDFISKEKMKDRSFNLLTSATTKFHESELLWIEQEGELLCSVNWSMSEQEFKECTDQFYLELL